MKPVAPDVYVLEDLRGANVYLLVTGSTFLMVDSGMPADFERITSQIMEARFGISNLVNIFLTHSHGDHAGCASHLARLSGAKITVHEKDIPYLSQQTPYPTRTPGQKIVYGLMNRLVFRLDPITVDGALKEGDALDEWGDLRVVHTPGHTPGSASLYDCARKILFCGDALFNAHPLTGTAGLRFPIAPVTLDRGEARASVEKISRLEINMLCPGHGEPILDNPREQILALLG